MKPQTPPSSSWEVQDLSSRWILGFFFFFLFSTPGLSGVQKQGSAPPIGTEQRPCGASPWGRRWTERWERSASRESGAGCHHRPDLCGFVSSQGDGPHLDNPGGKPDSDVSRRGAVTPHPQLLQPQVLQANLWIAPNPENEFSRRCFKCAARLEVSSVSIVRGKRRPQGREEEQATSTFTNVISR